MLNAQKCLPSTRTESRNYGVDLLRIVSMIMIVILHVLSQGGILDATQPLSVQNGSMWFIEIATFCAVDCYALISGYVGYGKRTKYSNIINLCFQVMFYPIIITAIFYFFRPEHVSIKMFIKYVFPFAFDTYWYFSAYFCLFFVMPFLNIAIEKLDKSTMQKLIISYFIVFSVLPTLLYDDFPTIGGGYTFLWIALLYILGAYLKKYGNPFKYKNYKNLCGYFIFVLATWLFKEVTELITSKVLGTPILGDYLVSFNSPTVLICAVFLFLFFSNISCGEGLKKFIGFFAPVTFGVYLFHQEPLIRDTFIKGAFDGYLSFNPFVTVLAVIGTALCIWLLGSFVDRIRLEIFKLLKIRQLSEWIEKTVRKVLLSIKRRISRESV